MKPLPQHTHKYRTLRVSPVPEVPISPCRAVPTCPFPFSSTMSPQGDPQPLSSFISKTTLGLGGQARRWSLMESAEHVSGRARARCLEGKDSHPRSPMKQKPGLSETGQMGTIWRKV